MNEEEKASVAPIDPPTTSDAEAATTDVPSEESSSCRKCISAWCKSVQYLQWTVLILSMLLICLIVVAVFVDLHQAGSKSSENNMLHGATQIKGAEINSIWCPNRWLLYDQRCYYFSNEKKTWKSSKIFCSLNQARLAVIMNPVDMTVLQRYKTDTSYWIGLVKEEDGWKWEAGFNFYPSLFPLTEHDSTMKCAHLYMGKAEAAHCDSLKRWICIKLIF